MKGTQTLLFALLLIISVHTQHQTRPVLPDIETATIDAGLNSGALVLRSNVTAVSYTHPFRNNYPTVPAVALALNSFDATKNTGFGFLAIPARITTTNVLVALRTFWELSNWTSLRFTLLAASRPDVILGTNIFQKLSSNSNSLSVALRTPLAFPHGFVARAFLSGIEITDSQSSIDFELVSGVLNSTHFSFLLSSSNVINSAAISYLILNPQGAGFASYGSAVELNQLSAPVAASVHSSLNDPNIHLFGLVSFKSSATGKIGLTAAIDSTFVLRVSPIATLDVVISYIFIGSAPRQACAPGAFPFYASCVASCESVRANSIVYSDGTPGCVICSAEANLVAGTNGCVCQTGFTLNKGVCVANQNTATTAHINGARPIFGGVINQMNLAPVNNHAAIQTLCPPGTVWNGAICVAVAPQPVAQPIVQPIPQPVVQPVIQNSAQPECLFGYYWNGAICVPNTPTPAPMPNAIPIFNPNESPICPFGASWSGSSCVCREGFVASGFGTCVSFQTQANSCSGLNQIALANGNCSCRAGFYFVNGRCEPGVECPLNSVRQSPHLCTCLPGFYNISGFCTRCPSNGWWNGSICTYNCPANSIFNATNNNCDCISGYYSVDGECKPCPAGSFPYRNSCVTCPLGSVYSGSQCKCADGSVLNTTTGLCQTTCPAFSRFDSIQRRCICTQPNYAFNDDGVCKQCPQNSDGANCIQCPAQSTFDANTKKCTCSGKRVLVNNKCEACPAPGFIHEGLCIVCPVNSAWDPGCNSCECFVGFEKSGASGICKPKCSSTQIFDIKTKTCVSCPANKSPDTAGTSCVCSPGFIPKNDTTNNCVAECPFGGVQSPDGGCVVCDEPKIYNFRFKVCSCPAEFTEDPVTKKCNRKCGYGEILNTQTNVCECRPDFYMTTCCQPCPATCASCSAPDRCTSCIANHVLKDNRCVPQEQGRIRPVKCKLGTFNTGNNTCSKCPQDCVKCTAANTCNTCGAGKIPVGGFCVGLPTTVPPFVVPPIIPPIVMPPVPPPIIPAGQRLVINITSTRLNMATLAVTARVTPTVTEFSQRSSSPTAIQTASRGFLQARILNSNGAVAPSSGFCRQNPTNLELWDCTISSQNQPFYPSQTVEVLRQANGAVVASDKAPVPMLKIMAAKATNNGNRFAG